MKSGNYEPYFTGEYGNIKIRNGDSYRGFFYIIPENNIVKQIKFN